MMKKKLSRFVYRFFQEALKDASEKDIISTQQSHDILAFYEERRGLDFIRVLVSIGSILIGLGVLLFIAGNWQVISNPFKVIIIVSFLAASMTGSFLTAKKRPITSQALLYLSVLIFGAGLFLINLAYNFNVEAYTINFVWALGALLLSSVYKDTILFVFAHVLAFLFLTIGFSEAIYIQGFILLVIFFAGNYYFNYQKLITFGSLTLLLVFILYIFNDLDVLGLYTALAFFAIGLGLYYFKHQINFDIFQFFGVVVMGIAGFALSFREIWQELEIITNGTFFAIPLSMGIVVYMFTLVRKRQITPLIVIAAFILRYYFDTLYDFLPRSLFFIIGGFMVLGMGYYIERFRRLEVKDEVA
jgi:uncharacterized membrane protein